MSPINNSTIRAAVTPVALGLRVDRATATLPQTGASALFNVLGGRVAMTAIVGEVTTIMGAVANNTSLEANPTTGTTAAICAVLATENDEVGTLYSIEGTKATALLGVDAGGVALQSKPVVLPVGSLDLRCAANNTGSVKWSLWYLPLDDGAYVEAA
jgi:hypothetical protein